MSDEKLIRAGRAIAKRNMEIMKAGAAAQGQGPDKVAAAMREKYVRDYRGTGRRGVTALGGTSAADENYGY